MLISKESHGIIVKDKILIIKSIKLINFIVKSYKYDFLILFYYYMFHMFDFHQFRSCANKFDIFSIAFYFLHYCLLIHL